MLACVDLRLVGLWYCGLTPQFSGGDCLSVLTCQGASLGLWPVSVLGVSVPQCLALCLAGFVVSGTVFVFCVGECAVPWVSGLAFSFRGWLGLCFQSWGLLLFAVGLVLACSGSLGHALGLFRITWTRSLV